MFVKKRYLKIKPFRFSGFFFFSYIWGLKNNFKVNRNRMCCSNQVYLSPTLFLKILHLLQYWSWILDLGKFSWKYLISSCTWSQVLNSHCYSAERQIFLLSLHDISASFYQKTSEIHQKYCPCFFTFLMHGIKQLYFSIKKTVIKTVRCL